MGRTTGELIRQQRERRGWSLGQLADELGLTKSAVSQWETGLIEPSLDRLRQVAAACEVPIGALIGEPRPRRAAGGE